MTDKNISPDAYIPADAELCNQDIDRSIDDVTLPLTSNFVTVAADAQQNVQHLQGDLVFQFSTGEDEWIQVPKSWIGVDYSVKADAGNTAAEDMVSKCLAPCLWQSGRFEIEGQRVATSNNYTVDYMISNRLQYSADYNKIVNQVNYYANAAYTQGDAQADEAAHGADVAAFHTSVDNLGAFFYRTENMLLPPNTHYRLVFTPETYEVFKQKCSFVDTRVAGQTQRNEISIRRIYLNLHRIRRTTKPDGEYQLRFMSVESNMSTPVGTSHNIQYQVSSKMRKCGVVMVSTAATTEAAAKIMSPLRFRYVTDVIDTRTNQGKLAATSLSKLQIKSGSLMMPNSILDFTSNTKGVKEAYLHYLNSVGKYNDMTGAPESFLEWLAQGPIYVEDAVKGAIDLSTNLQIEATFVAQPAAVMYTFQVNESYVTFVFGGPNNAVPMFKNLQV